MNMDRGKILWITMLVWTFAGLAQAAYADKVCRGIDVKGNLNGLRRLTNCTIVRGSVLISMIDYSQESLSAQTHLRFPELREITGCLLIAFTQGVVTFADVFPNLVIIRGNKLVGRFALVIFDNENLEHFALESLTTIENGLVAIMRNPMLCYAHAIDWHSITRQDELDEKNHKYFIQNTTYAVCPTVRDCTKCDPQHCWDANNCQQRESGFSADGKIKCHSRCVGGCVNDTADGCTICRGPLLDKKCVDKCPPDRIFNPILNICVKDCALYNMFAMNGVCLLYCPPGWSHLSNPRLPRDFTTCYQCDGPCPTVCEGTFVAKLKDTYHYYGCTVINGSITLHLENEFSDPNKLLRYNLGQVQQILGALIIKRSAAITDLSFFEKLSLIHHIPPENSTLLDDKFAVRITNNPYLNGLFDFEKFNRTIKVIGGAMIFHNNPKLCVQEIEEFIENVDHNRTNNFVEPTTNGYDETCYYEVFETSVIIESQTNVIVVWEKYEVSNAADKLIGYELYYLATKHTNITYTTAIDSCAKFIWESTFIAEEDLRLDYNLKRYRHKLADLHPNTQYAYYVKAHVTVKSEETSVNVTQGQSEIQYFRTFPNIPLPPFVTTVNKTKNTINVEWFHPSWDDNSGVDRYLIDIYIVSDTSELVDQRNYCVHPKQIMESKNQKYISSIESRVWCCEKRHNRFVTGYYGLEGDPDMCGPADPDCQNQATYHMLDANTTYGTDEMESVRQEELRFLDLLPYNPKYGRGALAIWPVYRHSTYMFTKWLAATRKDYSFRHLKPFERYAIQLQSCNHQGCGQFFRHYERTLRDVEADSVSFSTKIIDRDVVSLIVNPPSQPNGQTVAFIAERRMINMTILQTICATPNEMRKTNFTFYFGNMTAGTHIFRIRSISLGADGPWTDYQSIVVDSAPWQWGTGVIITVSVCGSVVILFCLTIRFCTCDQFLRCIYLVFPWKIFKRKPNATESNVGMSHAIEMSRIRRNVQAPIEPAPNEPLAIEAAPNELESINDINVIDAQVHQHILAAVDDADELLPEEEEHDEAFLLEMRKKTPTRMRPNQ